MRALFPNLLRQLVLLRWWAVAGQALAVWVATAGLGLPLPARWLWGGVAALAAFNLWAAARARQESTPAEVLGHLAVDMAQLSWMIAWSGGALNPFASLLLLPVALVAVAFPPRWVLATLLLAGAGYATCMRFGPPLPHLHGAFGDTFDLHLWGMAINFAVSALVFAFFLARLAAALRAREAEVGRLRERFARDEGILALATHAAAVAHELNTPLGSLTLLLEDHLAQCAPAEAERGADLRTMAALVDECRDRVRALAAPADAATDAAAAIDGVIERWQLLRPAVVLQREGQLADGLGGRVDPAVGHLLLALLNNAADASAAAGSAVVRLRLEAGAGRLHGRVRDFGHGLDGQPAPHAPALFRSTKPDGLGIGLALSHATVERLGGRLVLSQAAGGGTEVRFDVPLAPPA